MALIPGSYARAAGLQSEINKVTITRVAGSEVQFRRTIDTYQKDLRYNVNQIGREQKLLRRSMKKYYKKLREGKKERKEREAKEKEDSERLKLHAKQFREAEEAVRRNVLVLKDPNEEAKEGNQDEGVLEQNSASEQQNAGLAALPESPDSGIGSEGDDKASTDAAGSKSEGAKRKVFLTSQRAKMPYLKAKRGPRDKNPGNKQSHKHEDTSEEETSEVAAETGEEGVFLPVINEEGEDCGDQSKHGSDKPLSKSAGRGHSQTQTESTERQSDNNKTSQRPTQLGRTKAVPVTCLNTKQASASDDAQYNGEDTTTNETTNSSADPDAEHPRSRKPSFATMAAVVMMTTKAPRRKRTDVSYSDLIKLQHTQTSGTKRLFTLVDRLASKHGIVDPPPPLSSSRSSSLDPRSNVKIKKRGHGPESQMSDVMVKQAAALYAMKYGYSALDDVDPHDVVPPHFLSMDVSDEVAGGRDVEEFWNEYDVTKKDSSNGRSDITQRKFSMASTRQDSVETDQPSEVPPRRLSVVRLKQDSTSVIRTDQVDGQSDVTSRKLSVTSVRRNSTDVTSPHYAFSETASSVFQEIMHDGTTASVDLHGRRRSRSKSRHLLSMSELSEQASRVRERSFNAPDSYNESSGAAQPDNFDTQGRRDSRTMNRMSPLPRRSRSLNRARRDSVRNQLQQRLSEQSEAGNMAWQSAFGRLKVLHTLHDLSQHFTKDST